MEVDVMAWMWMLGLIVVGNIALASAVLVVLLTRL